MVNAAMVGAVRWPQGAVERSDDSGADMWNNLDSVPDAGGHIRDI